MGGSPSTPSPATGGSTRTSPKAARPAPPSTSGRSSATRASSVATRLRRRTLAIPQCGIFASSWVAPSQGRRAPPRGDRRQRRRSQLLGPVRRALHQLRLRLFPVRDPWQRLPYEAPLAMFGEGARHGFDWVFEGDTTI